MNEIYFVKFLFLAYDGGNIATTVTSEKILDLRVDIAEVKENRMDARNIAVVLCSNLYESADGLTFSESLLKFTKYERDEDNLFLFCFLYLLFFYFNICLFYPNKEKNFCAVYSMVMVVHEINKKDVTDHFHYLQNQIACIVSREDAQQYNKKDDCFVILFFCGW